MTKADNFSPTADNVSGAAHIALCYQCRQLDMIYD